MKQRDNRATIRFLICKYTILYTLHLINIVVTYAVNAAYVNAILSDPSISRAYLLFIQGAVGLFKILWNGIYIPWCAARLSTYMSQLRCMQNRFIMSITNFILAPCVATLVINQSCFYYVFKELPAVTSSVDFTLCVGYYPCGTEHCCSYSQPVAFSTTSYPSFKYSNACGSALLVTYIPVLLYSYLLYGVFVQLFRFWICWNVEFINRISIIAILETMIGSEGLVARVKGRDFVVTLALHATVLLTFGIASPILGIVIIVSIISDCYTTKLLLGKFLYTNLQRETVSIETNLRIDSVEAIINPIGRVPVGRISTVASLNSPEVVITPVAVNILEHLDMYDSWRGVFASYTPSIIVVCVFWAILFFDMIIDKYSLVSGIVVTSVYAIVVPLFLRSLRLLVKFQYTKKFFLFEAIERFVDRDFPIDEMITSSSRQSAATDNPNDNELGEFT